MIRWLKRSLGIRIAGPYKNAVRDNAIIPIGTSRRVGMYRVSTVVEYLGTPTYAVVADCGHCFEDVGEPTKSRT